MPRSDRQKAADEALSTVILETWRAYYEGEPYANGEIPPEAALEGVPMEYIVIGTMHSISDDGGSYTHVFQLYSDSNVPVHRLLGLVEYAKLRLANLVQE